MHKKNQRNDEKTNSGNIIKVALNLKNESVEALTGVPLQGVKFRFNDFIKIKSHTFTFD